MDGGLQGMKQLLSQNRNITAVICANDMTAIGALRACKELGVQVPVRKFPLLELTTFQTFAMSSPNKQHTVPLD